MATKKHTVVTKTKEFLSKTKKATGVTLAQDKDGYFCYTHRARCKSYKTIAELFKTKTMKEHIIVFLYAESNKFKFYYVPDSHSKQEAIDIAKVNFYRDTGLSVGLCDKIIHTHRGA